MGSDDEHDERGSDAPRSGPLPPDDRLWRHPSELAGGTPAPSAWQRPAPAPANRRPTVALAVASACLAGAVVVLGVLVVATPGTDVVTPAAASTTRPTATFAPLAATEDLDPSVAATVAALEIDGPEGPTRATAIWHGDRWLLAPADAVEGDGQPTEMEVLVDGARQRATVVGTDPTTAVALLRVDDPSGPGDAPAVATAAGGQRVAVVGSSPDGGRADGGVRAIAAAVERTDARATVGGQVLHGVLVLDRPLPAEAVGALVVDERRAAVAVVVASRSGEGGAVAVPAGAAFGAADDLRDDGKVRRAWLGVRATDHLVDDGGTGAPERGAQLRAVQAGSPAATAGLASGDVIVEIDGTPIDDASDLVMAIKRWAPGQTVRITWNRDGQETTATVVLGG